MEDDHSVEDPTADLLTEWLDGRNDLLHRTLNMIPHRERTGVITNMLSNETAFINILNRIHTSHVRNTTLTAIVTLNMNNNPNATMFSAPVPIVPSPAQIAAAVSQETVNRSSISNCAICQETIDQDLVRITHCGHLYHRSCLDIWFRASPRCPVCRYDIREMGQPTETSADATQTSSQSQVLWEGH